MTEDAYTHIYAWGNNSVRARYKGKPCRVVAKGSNNSIRIQFEDGSELVSSRWSIRRREAG